MICVFVCNTRDELGNVGCVAFTGRWTTLARAAGFLLHYYLAHKNFFLLQRPSLSCRPVLKHYQLAAKLEDAWFVLLYDDGPLMQILNCPGTLQKCAAKRWRKSDHCRHLSLELTFIITIQQKEKESCSLVQLQKKSFQIKSNDSLYEWHRACFLLYMKEPPIHGFP
jgi:hypothetical protein